MENIADIDFLSPILEIWDEKPEIEFEYLTRDQSKNLIIKHV